MHVCVFDSGGIGIFFWKAVKNQYLNKNNKLSEGNKELVR